MGIEIQFIEGLKELTLPIIRLTKSRNGKTGTATFIFIHPDVFNQFITLFIHFQPHLISNLFL